MMVDGTDSEPNQNDLMAITTDFDSNFYPNWINLPPELLPTILKFLRIVDNIRFGAVCTYWYSAAACSTHPPASQPPFLLLAGNKTGKSDIFQLFDLSIKRFYKIRIPQLRDRLCIGSSEGKLIYADNRAELQVLDPITGSRFDLPSITTLPEVGDHPELDTDGNFTGYLFNGYGSVPQRKVEVCPASYFNNAFYWKVIICPRSSAIVVLFQISSHVALCLPGDQTWTIVQPEPLSDKYGPYLHLQQKFLDAVFYKDAIYIISGMGILFSLKIGRDGYKLDSVCEVLASPIAYQHLAVVDGELFLVNRYVDYVDRDPEDPNFDGGCPYDCLTRTFEVRKLNWGTMRWKIIKSIGEYAMFLGLNTSFSLSAKDFPELKANSIYFTDIQWGAAVLCPRSKRDLGVFHFEDGTIESCYPGENDLHLTWPPPIWFTPKVAPCRRGP